MSVQRLRKFKTAILAPLALLCLHEAAIYSQCPSAYALTEAEDNYPRITAMEKFILGSTHTQDQLADRLSRMETKAFGKVSDKSDLSDRTDALQSYVESKSNTKLVQPGPGYDASDEQAYENMQSGQSANTNTATYSTDAAAPTTQYPRVTALEQAILGQAYEQDQLADRLSRMETKAFGKTLSTQALGDRTDALEDYAEKKLHKKILGQSAPPSEGGGGASGGSSNGGGGGSSFFAKAASALLGMPIGAPGTPMGQGGIMGNNNGSSGGGYFIPGVGPFGGIRMRPRSSVQPTQDQIDQQQTMSAAAQAEEAIIDSPNQPAPGTRLITKVSWCEKRVFGYVASDRHLPERLTLLNDALKFDPGKKGTDLMDDIDKMMKSAANHVPPKVPGQN